MAIFEGIPDMTANGKDVHNMPPNSDLSEFIEAATGEKYDSRNKTHVLMFEIASAWAERRVKVNRANRTLADDIGLPADERNRQMAVQALHRPLTQEEEKQMYNWFPGRYDFRS